MKNKNQVNATMISELKKQYEQAKTTTTKPFKISDRQISYIEHLHHQNIKYQDTPIFELLSQLTEHKVSDWTDLSKKETSYVINYLMTPETRTQKLYDNIGKRTRPMFKSRDIIIEAQFEYEYGYQIKQDQEKLYYLRFYDLCMLDYDDLELEQVKAQLNQVYLKALIYQTFAGYRVFIVSKRLDYRAPSTLQLMRFLKVDPWYLTFVQHHGFKVRLNPKKGRNEPFVAKFVAAYGNAPVDGYCQNLVKIHDEYIKRVNQV